MVPSPMRRSSTTASLPAHLPADSISLVAGLVTLVAGLAVLFADVAAAQSGLGPAGSGVSVARDLSPVARSFGVLVVGGLVVLLAPGFAERMVETGRRRPGAAFLYGLVFGIGTLLVLAILAATGVGMILAIPGLLVFGVVAVVGGTCGSLLLGAVVTGSSSATTGVVVLVSAILAGVLSAIPVLGDLANFVVATVGLGMFVLYWQG